MWTKGKVVYSVCFPFGDMAGLAEGKCSHLCYSLTVIWAQKSTHKIQTVEIPGLFNTIFVHQNLNQTNSSIDDNPFLNCHLSKGIMKLFHEYSSKDHL